MAGEYVKVSIHTNRSPQIRQLKLADRHIWTTLQMNAGRGQRFGCGLLVTDTFTPITKYDIAAELEIDVRTVDRAIKKMVDLDLLDIYTDTENQEFIYIKKFMQWQDKTRYLSTQRDTNLERWFVKNASNLWQTCVELAANLRQTCTKHTSVSDDTSELADETDRECAENFSSLIDNSKQIIEEEEKTVTPAGSDTPPDKPKSDYSQDIKNLRGKWSANELEFIDRAMSAVTDHMGVKGLSFTERRRLLFLKRISQYKFEFILSGLNDYMDDVADRGAEKMPVGWKYAAGYVRQDHEDAKAGKQKDSSEPEAPPPTETSLVDIPDDDGTWSRICAEIKESISEQSHNTWFTQTRGLEGDSVRIFVHCPNNFYREWLSDNYRGQIQSAMLELGMEERDVVFVHTKEGYVERMKEGVMV